MSVAASTVWAVGSLRSTSKRNTGTSGSAFAGGGLCMVGLPSACVQVPPKSLVTKTWPMPVADVKPERLSQATLESNGSIAIPVACVESGNTIGGSCAVLSIHSAPFG